MAHKDNLFVRIAINSVVEAGTLMVSGLLQEIKAKHEAEPEVYKEIIQAGTSFFALLERAAAKTTTKTDDKIVSVFKIPLDEAAKTDDITS